jgi:hypothetical protein
VSRRFALTLGALIALAACAGPAVTPSPAPASSLIAPTATVAATPVARPSSVPTPALPVAFTSRVYGYSIVVPAGWAIGPAALQWDAASSPGHTDPVVDKFASPADVSAFAFAGPVTVDLTGFVQATIAWTVRDHGDTCPATGPEKTEPIEIGGEPGMLLSWNCGILVNDAVLVRGGTGFVLVMRDLSIAAATDPADRAILEVLLDSITFPT